MSEIPGRHADQFNLRLPAGMRDRLKAAAEANKRSLNAEIVARLDHSFYADLPQFGPTNKELDDRMTRMYASIRKIDKMFRQLNMPSVFDEGEVDD